MKNESLVCPNKEVVNAENKCAAFLSIVVPGLGQIYKGHVVAGLLWMFLGMPIAVWTGILLGLATAGALLCAWAREHGYVAIAFLVESFHVPVVRVVWGFDGFVLHTIRVLPRAGDHIAGTDGSNRWWVPDLRMPT